MGCYAVNSSCKVTDRVTGETFIRGAAAQLTALNKQLKNKIAALEAENNLMKQETKQLKEEKDLLQARIAFFQELFQVRPDLPSCFMSHATWI